ncbi:transglycosylase [Lucifera butyrica]|uniref:Transglycosylase n=1 Tax=Lucifera butyrica TaxID=1351585 RepID=A0A498RAE6_9FIRM|nr:PBP1A family penicillin-binding protein [Lucifera butyrica]VBB07920.1 transglycosylase [Lucifera butyrica]
MRHSIRSIIIMAFVVSSLVVSGCAFWGLPEVNNLENLKLMTATQVFDIHGQLISKLFEENRIVVSINNISPYIQEAIIDNEDTRFYSHMGVDPIGILRALWIDLLHGRIVEGGSTITQQLAKNMFLTQEQTLSRKLKEALLAIIIERKFSKQEILQAYLNQIYFGEGAYGVEAASQVYFGKHAVELSLGESAMLAGLPRGPNIFSPYVDKKAALQRRQVVLEGMVKAGDITEEEAQRAAAEPLKLAGRKKRTVQASYFLDYIANELVGRYGANRVYKGGLKVYTTLDSNVQKAAERALGKYQGAVLALDPRTGYIEAMVGGRNYAESQINRVITEVRQPGSAFKPFVYATALNRGLAANTVIVDEPINIDGYAPHNYDEKFHGPMILKKALRLSINIVAVKLAQQLGVEHVLDLAKSMGITTLVPGDNNLAAALGGLTQGVNLMELTTAYSAIANGGILSRPIAILKVLDQNGQVLEETNLHQQAVLKPEMAYILMDMMKGVLENGTGKAGNIGRPSAGKTGTTDNFQTAWFVGFTPDLLTGIYVGNDDHTPVGISGAEVAGMWGTMMKQALKDSKPVDFPVPPNVITGVPIAANTGKLATPRTREIEYCSFIKGTEPTEPDHRKEAGPPAFGPDQNKDTPRWKLSPWW